MRLPRILSALGITTAAGAAAGAALAWWGNRELTNFHICEYGLPLAAPGTLNGSEFRILHISDLHMLPGQWEKTAFVQSLADFDPDLVVNTGDNLGDAAAVPDVLTALDPLLHLPGVFVFGSNDYFAPRPVNPFIYLVGKKRKVSREELPWRGMRSAFIERGWMDATHRRIEEDINGFHLLISGVDDPHHDLDDVSLITGTRNPATQFAIGLSHSPEPRVLRHFAEEGYDLSLHGHTHGGQLCLPNGRAIVTNCGIDRKRASGVHLFDNLVMHTTNGLGTSKYVPFRIFCAPSAARIRICEPGTELEPLPDF